MERLKHFFSNPRNILVGSLAIGVILLAFIAIAIAALVSNPSDDKNSSDSTEKGSFSGNVSQLSGKTSSQRNLKGLTLRINQIETCNPGVVSAYVAVSSDAGVVNKNFKKDDVKVYVDGKQIDSFDFNAVDTEKTPLTNVLAIDHSGSMTSAAMSNAKGAATSYVTSLKPNDQVGILQFDNLIEMIQPITRDKAAAVKAINTIQPRGNTSLYDALATGIKAVPDCGRKAVTLLTDGNDTTSANNSINSVIDLANRQNLPVFSVGIKGSQFNPTPIKEISENTGGQYLEANTPTEITNLYKNIDGQLTGQFAANLRLNIKKDGSTHKLRIVSTVEGSATSSERSFVY